MLARDVALFEQLGCLSLHQVFVVGPEKRGTRELAIRMSSALERGRNRCRRRASRSRDAAEIRGVRERARWRAIAGEPVELFEGRGLEWTLVFEPRAGFIQNFAGLQDGARDRGARSRGVSRLYCGSAGTDRSDGGGRRRM